MVLSLIPCGLLGAFPLAFFREGIPRGHAARRPDRQESGCRENFDWGFIIIIVVGHLS